MADPRSGVMRPSLAYATGGLEGIAGRSKATPEDFVVEELPAYTPSGTGEHLYLYVEKRGIPTEAVVTALQRALAVPVTAIGYAGKKDAHAVTRQWLSVHTPADPDPATLAAPGWRVLEAGRHGNKLRPGHLRGNRFALAVRDATPGPAAAAILQRLAAEGFPNYFGPQRVGQGLANARDGRALLQAGGGPSARRAKAGLERRRFAVNAYQAALFNALVAQRLDVLGSLAPLLAGDLAVLHRNGAAFPLAAEGLPDAQARADAHELSASAPLFGTHAPLAEGEPGAWERALLAREGLTAERFRLGGKRLSPKGERRAVRAFADALHWDWAPEDGEPVLRLTFTLGPGCYATSLLRELMKNDGLAALEPPAPAGAPAPATQAAR